LIDRLDQSRVPHRPRNRAAGNRKVGSAPDNSSRAEDEKLRRLVPYSSALLELATDVCVTRNIDEGHLDRHARQFAVCPVANRAIWVVLE